jgi:hypothetical protein
VNPYLETLSPGAYARLPRAERVVLQLLRDRRLTEVRWAARGLGHGVAPRELTTGADGRTYWGGRVPESAGARRELDLTELEPATRPFSVTQFRHEITEITRGPGASVDLTVRTYDPALRLPVGPQRASLLISPGRHRLTVPFRLSPVRPGVFEGRVRLDPASARLPLSGFAGVRHPMVRLTCRGRSNRGVLLAPPAFPPLTARVPHHRVTIEPEGHGPGRLQLRWQPTGLTASVLRPAAHRLAGPRLRRAARLAASLFNPSGG